MPTIVKRSNGVYYQVTCLGGRRIWRSTGARSMSEAKKIIKEGVTRAEFRPDLTVTQLAIQFFPYAQTNFAASTVELYRAAIKTFVRLLGDHLLGSYSALDIERFKTLRVREVSAVRVNIEFRTTKAFFQKAVNWSFLEKNPFGGVKQIKIPPRRPIYLTKEEFSRLIASIDLPWLKNLVQFAVSTMMRVGEIVNLRWDSVDLQRRLILVENTEEFRIKTTNPRSVPMNDWVFSFLATKPNKTSFVFTLPSGNKITVRYASRKFKDYVRIARLPEEIHFHSL